MKPGKVQRRSPAFTAFLAWVSLTLLVLANILYIYVRLGNTGFEVYIQEWAFTHLPTTLASVAISWLLAGLLIYLLTFRKINPQNIFTWTGFFLVGLSYLNMLRERFRYGDIEYYIEAARNLSQNQPLPDTYFYPPLWATLLKFLLPFGEEAVLLWVWVFNVLALFAFYFLLHRVLEQYGFSPRMAALVTAGFMLVNAPLLRTLVYMQVNLHTLNAVFLGLLLFRRSPPVSALMMALAVHLKASPAVLVLAFLLTLDWRWLAWFIAGNLLVASITLLTSGISPFLDFVRNSTVLTSERASIFHDTSFDSLFNFPTQIFGFPDPLAQALIYTAKAVLLLATVFLVFRAIRNQGFLSTSDVEGKLYNALPPLFILMTLASPIVWEHHGIFLTIAFLVLLKKLQAPFAWVFFGFAYFFEFLLPTFDFFPWSYGRLVAPLICLGLMWRISTVAGPSSWFERTNRWLDSLESPRALP